MTITLNPLTVQVPGLVSSTALSSVFTGATTLPIFGVNSHLTIDDINTAATTVSPAQQVAICTALGAGMMRIDAIDWPVVEPSQVPPASYVWTAGGSTITTLISNSILVDVVLAYSNTIYESSYFTGPTDTTGINAFAAYGKGAVAEFGVSGIQYEIWNEQNLSNGAGQYSWAPAANAANYATLFNATVTAMIGQNAGAVILSGGLTPGGGSGFIAPNTFVASFCSDATLTHCAALGYHPYSWSGTPNPESMLTDVPAFASASGTALPIWCNEMGAMLGSQQAPGPQYQGVAVARMLLCAIYLKVPQIAIYEAISNQGFGMFSWSYNAAGTSFNYQALPAAVAYAAITSACAGMTTFDCASDAVNQLVACVTIHKASSHVRIVWTWNVGAEIRYQSVEASISTATATDVFGNSVPVAISGNVASFNLSFWSGPVILTLT